MIVGPSILGLDTGSRVHEESVDTGNQEVFGQDAPPNADVRGDGSIDDLVTLPHLTLQASLLTPLTDGGHSLPDREPVHGSLDETRHDARKMHSHPTSSSLRGGARNVDRSEEVGDLPHVSNNTDDTRTGGARDGGNVSAELPQEHHEKPPDDVRVTADNNVNGQSFYYSLREIACILNFHDVASAG